MTSARLSAGRLGAIGILFFLAEAASAALARPVLPFFLFVSGLGNTHAIPIVLSALVSALGLDLVGHGRGGEPSGGAAEHVANARSRWASAPRILPFGHLEGRAGGAGAVEEAVCGDGGDVTTGLVAHLAGIRSGDQRAGGTAAADVTAAVDLDVDWIAADVALLGGGGIRAEALGVLEISAQRRVSRVQVAASLGRTRSGAAAQTGLSRFGLGNLDVAALAFALAFLAARGQAHAHAGLALVDGSGGYLATLEVLDQERGLGLVGTVATGPDGDGCAVFGQGVGRVLVARLGHIGSQLGWGSKAQGLGLGWCGQRWHNGCLFGISTHRTCMCCSRDDGAVISR